MNPIALLTNDHDLTVQTGPETSTSATGAGALRYRRKNGSGDPAWNLHPNPYVATATGGWAHSGFGSGGRVAFGHDNGYSYQAVSNGASGNIRPRNNAVVVVPANTSITLSVWMHATAEITFNAWPVRRYDVDGVTGSFLGAQGATLTLPANEWTRFSWTETTPAGVFVALRDFWVAFGSSPSGTLVSLTEAQIEVGGLTEFIPQVDGNGALLPGYGWSGAVGNSRSYREFWVTDRAVALIEEGTTNFWSKHPSTSGTHFDFNAYRTNVTAVFEGNDRPPNGAPATRCVNDPTLDWSGPMHRFTYAPPTPADGAYVFWLSIDTKGGAGPWAGRDVSNFVNSGPIPLAATTQWTRQSGQFTLPDQYTPRSGNDMTIGGRLNTPAGAMLVANPQLEYKDHVTTFARGDMGPGYTWAGTAYASASVRGAASITIPLSEPFGSLACWYSEDAGATWVFGYREGFGPLGTYGQVADDGAGNLVITSSRALLLAETAVFSDTLTVDYQADLASVSTMWTWEDLIPPWELPSSVPRRPTAVIDAVGAAPVTGLTAMDRAMVEVTSVGLSPAVGVVSPGDTTAAVVPSRLPPATGLAAVPRRSAVAIERVRDGGG